MIEVPAWFQRDVSRETLEQLTRYAALLRKWTARINLISKSSERDLEHRHIWDSAQIYEPMDGRWLDLGSGGGLPAVVVAILAQGDGRDLTAVLVESDQRKATFLRACARELDLALDVFVGRIEDVAPQSANIISARALADLDHLLGFSVRHLAAGGRCVFMKGATWQDEIKRAQQNWRFSCDASPSKTNPEAAILRIEEIERV